MSDVFGSLAKRRGMFYPLEVQSHAWIPKSRYDSVDALTSQVEITKGSKGYYAKFR